MAKILVGLVILALTPIWLPLGLLVALAYIFGDSALMMSGLDRRRSSRVERAKANARRYREVE